MNTHNQYETLVKHVLDNGVYKEDRTGTGTYSVFGYQMRFNLQEGFPLITTKKVHTKSVIAELLWFLNGGTNIKELHENGCTIWDEWADENGDLGPVYGKQWRDWVGPNGKHYDQISEAMRLLKEDPDSRRNVVSAWNVADLKDMALMPCHSFFQLYVVNGKLSMQLYMRSNDIGLGAPFNIASYALLTHMFAQQANLEVGELVYTIGDAHIYSNHVDKLKIQVERTPYKYPTLVIARKPSSIFDYKIEDFAFVNYHHHEHIPMKVAV